MGAIQNSINYALGTAAIASGLTNKKQVEKAQDKLDKSEENLTKTEGQLANTKEDLTNTKKDLAETKAEKSALEDEKNMKYGLNTFNVSNDLPTAKETNVDANDKINVISSNSINPSIGSSLADLLKNKEKINPYEAQQIMGFHALKMRDSVVAAKRELRERSRSRRDMISERARAAKEDGTYSFRNGKLVKENLKSGYQVSFFRPEITDENIQSCLKKFGSKLGPAYLGLFEGSPEISYCFKDKDKAMEFAKTFNQYSIWDNKEGKQILNDKYNESATVDYNVALDNFAKARGEGGNK